MGVFGITRDNMHRERVAAKNDAKETLMALKATWEQKGGRGAAVRIKRLARRIKILENQLRNMRP
jgi:hypothetical protein